MARGPWSDEELESLIYQVEVKGKPPRKVKIADRSKNAIVLRLHMLRKAGKITKSFVKREREETNNYTLSEIRLLEANTSGTNRVGIKELMKLLPRHSKESIKTQIKKRALSNVALRQRSQRARETVKKRQKILEYLKSQGKYQPGTVAAKALKVSPETVRRIRAANDMRFDHKKSLRKSPWYRKWYGELAQRRGKKGQPKRKKQMTE